MDEEEEKPHRPLAILFDGDNVPHGAAKRIIDEASRYGYLKIRRVYGDWSRTNLDGWRGAASDNAILQVQQAGISGKNSTDGALIIDAMDILYAGKVEGFCIVSSDGDYTRLALMLREHGKFVLGIGEKKTPKSLMNACKRFRYIETITERTVADGLGAGKTDAPPPAPGHDDGWTYLARRAVEESLRDDGWALLADVGNRLRVLDPAFDARTHGKKNLHLLVESEPGMFELDEHMSDGTLSGHLVRLRSDG